MATEVTLLERLSALLDADPLIDEVGLLFGVAEEDLTPDTAFQYADHKLGVAFCAGAPLFRQARTRFHELNPVLAETRRRSGHQVDDSTTSVITELVQCTRAILLISADFYTAWNARKALVDLGYLDAADEIRFTDLVFTLHAKSIDTWAYRRWLTMRLVSTMTSDEARERFLDEQIGVCERLAELKPRNYHAWSFRHWVVTQFATVDELRSELERMGEWCKTHITDHSGWNHRQYTVNLLLRRSSPEEASAVLEAELELLSGIMALYPTHEALWCHRRFIVHLLLHQYGACEAASDDQVAGVCQRVQSMERRVTSAESPDGLDSNGDSSLVAVASVCVREIEVAWRCKSKYARRYAVWCLARVQSWASGRRELRDALGGLSTACRKLLAVEDSTLQDLWESNSMAVRLGGGSYSTVQS